MLGTAFWDCYVGMAAGSTSDSVRREAADALIRTLMEMLIATPDDTSTGVAHAKKLAEDTIAADSALTGGLYSKVMFDAFVARGLWDERDVDTYIRDSSADTAAHPSPSPHWKSPDIWVRNNAPPADPNDPNDPNAGEDPDAGHQNPINDVPNYMYVRVHNKGAQPANGFTVTAYHCDPGTGMIWPDHFQSMGSLAVGQTIPAGGSVRVGPFIWTPQIVDHECLLAIVHGADDPAISETLVGSVGHWKIVRFDNNVGQRNVSPQNTVPGGKTKTTFFVRGGKAASSNRLFLDATALPPDTRIELRVLRRVTDGAASLQNLTITKQTKQWTTAEMHGGDVARINEFPLEKNDCVSMGLTIDFSLQAEHLERYPLVATQEQNDELAGKMTIEITAVKETEDYVYGNPRSRELHTVKCPFWPLISQHNKIPFETIQAGLDRGYNGCAFCLPEHNTG